MTEFVVNGTQCILIGMLLLITILPVGGARMSTTSTTGHYIVSSPPGGAARTVTWKTPSPGYRQGQVQGHLSDKSQLKAPSHSIQTFYSRKQMIKFTANIKSFSDIFSITKWQIIIPFCQPSFIQTKVCSMLSFALLKTNGTPSTLRLHSSVNQLIGQTRKLYGDPFTGSGLSHTDLTVRHR